MTTATPVPATPWRRCAAACYDGLLLFAIWVVSLMASVSVQKALGAARNDHVNGALLLLAGLAFFGWSWTHGGQTLGMRAWRLQVRREDGAGLRWPVAALRYALMLACWLTALAALALPLLPEKMTAGVPHRGGAALAFATLATANLFSALLDGRRRTLYDRLTSTEVVRLPREQPLPAQD